MVGYGQDKGIIPLAMEEMFKRIGQSQTQDLKFKVQASMLEIYNERVRDLFNPKNTPLNGLKMRENPKTGPYVEDLSSNLVSSYVEVSRLMEQGSKARTIGATNMNSTSSRAHTVFTIIFTQTKVERLLGKATDKVSKINLVDLAGSERAEESGATGDRLREACAINKSLSALGNCISALADLSTGKKKVFVPYRDSVLTWLLKESLGGNAKTIMMAAVSPADINHEETLSTLRYADRAKQIQTAAKVNEDPNQKLIRDLRAEIEALRAQLSTSSGERPSSRSSTPADPNPELRMELQRIAREKEEMREKLVQSEKLIAELNMSHEEQLRKSEEVGRQREEALKAAGLEGLKGNEDQQRRVIPHFLNLNEDPQLSECLVYLFKPGITRIGRKDATSPQDVQLAGLNIAKEHCEVENRNGVVELRVLRTSNGDHARTYVNGQGVSAGVELHTGDRVLLGETHFFKVVHPDEIAALRRKGEKPPTVDWEFAKNELAQKQGQMLSMKREEKEENEKADKERAELQQRIRELMEKLSSLEAERGREKAKLKQEEMARKERDMRRDIDALNKLLSELDERRRKERQAMRILEEKLLRAIPLVSEANIIGQELGKDIEFEVKLVTKVSAGANKLNTSVANSDLFVKVTQSTGVSSLWDYDKFISRLYIMRDAYLQYTEQGERFRLHEDQDPFYDPVDCMHIGTAYIYLDFLSYCIDIDETTPILDYKGKQDGELQVQIKVADRSGAFATTAKGDTLKRGLDWTINSNTGTNSLKDSVPQLLGTRMDLLVCVLRVKGVPIRFSRNVQVRYKFYKDVEDRKTEECARMTVNPDFQYSEHITVEPVTPEFLTYLQSSAIAFEVWGKVCDGNGPLPLPPSSAAGRKRRTMIHGKLDSLGVTSDHKKTATAGGPSLGGLALGFGAGGFCPAINVNVTPPGSLPSSRGGSFSSQSSSTATSSRADGSQSQSLLSDVPSADMASISMSTALGHALNSHLVPICEAPHQGESVEQLRHRVNPKHKHKPTAVESNESFEETDVTKLKRELVEARAARKALQTERFQFAQQCQALQIKTSELEAKLQAVSNVKGMTPRTASRHLELEKSNACLKQEVEDKRRQFDELQRKYNAEKEQVLKELNATGRPPASAACAVM